MRRVIHSEKMKSNESKKQFKSINPRIGLEAEAGAEQAAAEGGRGETEIRQK
jgi:hypothetical protein